MNTTALQTIEVAPAGTAVASVIVLHGLGADGTDFLPFADEVDLSTIGPVRWLLPRAPVRWLRGSRASARWMPTTS